MDSNAQNNALLHVSIDGNDTNNGLESTPLRTINAAAQIANPGDTIRVHAGVYRESVHPARGGTSNTQRITYEAADGENVHILGSELITGWEEDTNCKAGTWKASVPNTIFGDVNPYTKLISGDWFYNQGRPHHTGSLHFSGREFNEATTHENLQSRFWHAKVGKTQTTFWINCRNDDPNKETVEINVRPTVFYPKEEGINFITVRGFNMRHAATKWAPPTAEQVGLIGTNWSKGWIIEDNVITHSRCVGVTLGKHGDEHDNTSEDSAEGYVETIKRALNRGWNRDNIGSHIVRNNTIAYCEQAGIVGSLGAIFSEVSGNIIHDIHVRGLFKGAEQAGIKFHAPIDTLIAGNHIYRCNRAIWMDWMSQGTRITSNLCHSNNEQDLFLEVNHGPYIVDNNFLLSDMSIWTMSQGGAYVHNLVAGTLWRTAELGRETPYHPQSSVELAGITNIRGGDERYINNIFLQAGTLETVNAQAIQRIGVGENKNTVKTHVPYDNFNSGNQALQASAVVTEQQDGWAIRYNPLGQPNTPCPLIHSDALGTSVTSGLPYKDTYGKTFTFDQDYMGTIRTETSNAPGPIAVLPDKPTQWMVYRRTPETPQSPTAESA